MPSHLDSYQVLILLDVNFNKANEENEVNCEKSTNNLRLSLIKLFAYFSHRVHYNVKNLQWGYQFIDSSSLTQSRACGCSHGFRDFNLQNFEDFENQIDLEFEKATGRRTQERSQGSEEEDPIDVLGDSLKDVLYKFPWDRPDISSPVKKRQGHNKLPRTRSSSNVTTGKRSGVGVQDEAEEGTQTKKHNVVFLFSRCPLSMKDLLAFASCKEDSHALLKSLLSVSVQRELHHSCRINLFWVDGNETVGFSLAAPYTFKRSKVIIIMP